MLEFTLNGVRKIKGMASAFVTRGGYYIYTWRARRQFKVLHMMTSRSTKSRPSRVTLKRDGPEDTKSDGVKKLDWATRNPNRGEMMASTIKRWRRHPCKSIYSFWFFIHKRGTFWRNTHTNPSTNSEVFKGFIPLFLPCSIKDK
jgi:hypothetical protein